MTYVVTTDAVAGHTTVRTVGYVVATNPVPSGPFHLGIKSLATGRTVPRRGLVQVLDKARIEAVTEMTSRARRMGANAVVGLRFADRQVTSNWFEIVAFGTAVYVEPEDQNP
jgi:uncharacterized protein YbjQ (UPF0145 family)